MYARRSVGWVDPHVRSLSVLSPSVPFLVTSSAVTVGAIGWSVSGSSSSGNQVHSNATSSVSGI